MICTDTFHQKVSKKIGGNDDDDDLLEDDESCRSGQNRVNDFPPLHPCWANHCWFYIHIQVFYHVNFTTNVTHRIDCWYISCELIRDSCQSCCFTYNLSSFNLRFLKFWWRITYCKKLHIWCNIEKKCLGCKIRKYYCVWQWSGWEGGEEPQKVWIVTFLKPAAEWYAARRGGPQLFPAKDRHYKTRSGVVCAPRRACGCPVDEFRCVVTGVCRGKQNLS